MTIVQKTNGLGAVCYHLELKGTSQKVDVNPIRKILDTISAVKSKDDLGNIRVPDGNGGTTSLIPHSVTRSQKELVVKSLQNFVQVAHKMPADGSIRPEQSIGEQESFPSGRSSSKSDIIWGLSFENGACSYHEGADAARKFGLQTMSYASLVQDGVDVTLGGFWDAIKAAAGDIWHWVKHAYHEVKIKTVKGGVSFHH